MKIKVAKCGTPKNILKKEQSKTTVVIKTLETFIFQFKKVHRVCFASFTASQKAAILQENN